MGWEPLSRTNQDLRMKSESYECLVNLLAVRSIILRIIAAANDVDFSVILLKLSIELKTLENEVIPEVLRKFKCKEKDKIIEATVPFDGIERLREAYNSHQINFIAKFAESLGNSSFPDLIEVLQSAPCLEPLPLPELNKPASFNKFFLRASTCSETIAFVAAICNLAALQIRPNLSTKKTKKKRNETLITAAPENQVKTLHMLVSNSKPN